MAIDLSKLAVVQKADHCAPSIPLPTPTPQQVETCDSQFSGNLSGVIKMACCCPQLRSRTFVVQVPPQVNPTYAGYLQATINAWEAAGYIMLAHHGIDVGGGWIFVFTVGWYA
jgi:hypothetical protein